MLPLVLGFSERLGIASPSAAERRLMRGIGSVLGKGGRKGPVGYEARHSTGRYRSAENGRASPAHCAAVYRPVDRARGMRRATNLSRAATRAEPPSMRVV
jgi:hypothetical protein